MPTSSGAKVAVGLLGSLLACGFFWFVWPTPYEYTRKAPTVYRVNRFTGVQEMSTDTGWRPLNSPLGEDSKAIQAKADEALADRRKLGRNLDAVRFGDSSEFNGRAYIAYFDGAARYRLNITPYKGALKVAMQSARRDASIMTLKLYSASGFLVQDIDLKASELTRVVADRPPTGPKSNNVVPRGTTPTGRVTIGRLGQTLKNVKITSRSNGTGRIYYSCKAQDYLVLTGTVSGAYQVLLQNGARGWVPANSVATLPYDVTRPIDTASPPDDTLLAEGLLTLSPEAFDSVSYCTISWRW